MKKLITLCCLQFFWGLLFAQQPPAANANALVDNVSFAAGMIVDDIDNDGDKDILTRALNNVSGNRILFENTGIDGVFQPPSFFTHEKENLPLALGDFDGDGDLDLAAGLGAGLFFYENDGNNNFLPPSPPSDELADIEDILVADLDGDGDPDLVGRAANNLYWSENTDGQGLFSSPSLIAGPLPWSAAAMAAADMDQNGTLDIVLCGRPGNDDRPLLVVFQQSPSQWNFDIGQLTATALDNDVKLRLADLDGDSYPDVVLYSLQGFEHQIKIFNNLSGAAVFQEVYTQTGVYDFALGDIDLDGATDIAIQLIRSAEWLRNDGGFNWTAIDIPDDGILAPDIELADMNQDGNLDLLQFRGDLDPNDGAFYFPNLNAGEEWGPRHAIYHEITNTGGIASCDWDGDGDQDILWGDRGSNRLYWLENNNGQGAFNRNDSLASLPDGSEQLMVFDLGQDGDLDVIMSIQYDVPGPDLYLLAYLERTGTGPGALSAPVMIDTLKRKTFDVGDLDGDGDADLLAYHHLSGLAWYEQVPGGFTPHPLTSQNIAGLAQAPLAIADLDGDGHLDAMGYVGNQITWFLNLDGQGPGAQQVLTLPEPGFLAQAADLDGDGRPEMAGVYFDIPTATSYIGVVRYQPASQTFSPVEFSHTLSTGNFAILDVDQDGYPDFSTLGGTFLNLSGIGVFAPPIFPEINLTEAVMGDLTGDGAQDIIIGGFGLYWMENTAFARPALSGRLGKSDTDPCQTNETQEGIPNWLIRTESADGATSFVSTGFDGNYALSLPAPGAYQVQAVSPFPYWELCPADSTVQFPVMNSRSRVDFGAAATTECPFVTVSITTSRLRPCLPGYITIGYVNNGTAVAEDVDIEVVLQPGIMVLGTSLPWDVMTDSSLIFTIPQLGLFESGRIVLTVEPDCNTVSVGDLICTSVQTTPDSLCLPPAPLWDGSTLEATGYCQGDSIYFNLRNVGEGAMAEPRAYRLEIVNDDIIVFLIDDLQLGPDENLPVVIPADTLAIRLVALQDPEHPLAEDISLVVTGCGFPDSLQSGVVDMFPNSSGNPFRAVSCREVTSSFDPNAKEATPRGIGPEHLIEPEWPLDYTIHFQNTGNDTAFTVVLRDTLSPYLDLSSLRVQGGSHAFRWQLRPNRELVFTFENILLPDSTTNLEGSQGHVSYRIRPLPEAAPGSLIENSAAIYFDFNEPIFTNTVFHTIRRPQVYAVVDTTICSADIYLGQQWEADTSFVEQIALMDYDSLAGHHLTVLPTSMVLIDTILPQGSVLDGVLLNADTSWTVIVPVSDYCDQYITYQVDVISGIDEVEHHLPTFSVHPNPASNQVVVNWEASLLEPQYLSLYDARGKLLDRFDISGGTQQKSFELSHLPSGVYTLMLTGNLGRANRRLAVQQE